MFDDRKDAGTRLARALDRYKDRDVLVLAIPRGGVEVGYEVARYLNAEFAILVVRKLPFPDEPEAGFGAIAEDGSTYFVERARAILPDDLVEAVVKQQQEEISRRIAVMRHGRALPDIEGRTVILIDDGIAMGSTMRASIEMCKSRGAAKIVVAVPVTGEDRADEIARLVDEIVVLKTPRFFRAVAQVYRNWYDVPDEEVLGIMRKWEGH